MAFIELVERDAEVALPEKRLFLRPRPVDDAAPRGVPVGHVQHYRPEALLHELARYLGLKNLTPAFVYHGETIGCTGTLPNGKKVGVCSGGAGEFAADAKNLGCDLYITGEASWGDVIAAENVGMQMICAGHYATETFGVKALAKAMKRALRVDTVFIPRPSEPTTQVKELS